MSGLVLPFILRFVAVSVLVVWGSFSCPSSFAQAVYQSRLIAVMEHAPYGFYSSDGQAKGYLFDIAQAIVEKSELTAGVEILPHKRLLRYMNVGTVDCSLFAATPFVTANYRLVEPIGFNLAPGIIPRSGLDLHAYEDLDGLSIGVPVGVRFQDRFDEDDSLIKIVTKDYTQSVIMLENGRLDAIAGAWGSYRYNARLLGFEPADLFGQPLVFESMPIYLACGLHGPPTRQEEALEQATKELRETGVLIEIIESYLGPTP